MNLNWATSILLLLIAMNFSHCKQDNDPSLSLTGTPWGTHVTIEVGTETYSIPQALVNPYLTKFNDDGTLEYLERGVLSKAQWNWKGAEHELEIRYPSGDVRTLKVTLINSSQFNYMEYEIGPSSSLSMEQLELFTYANRLLMLSGNPTTEDKIKITFSLKK